MLNGYQVFQSPLVAKVTHIEKRVKGGYMNRWLIRVIETVVDTSQVLIMESERKIFMHPDAYQKLARELPRRESNLFGMFGD